MVRNKVVICKNFQIQPSELMVMPFWEYEMTVKECEHIAEEEKKQQEEQNGKQPSTRDYQRQSMDIMRGYNKQYAPPRMPSMPKMPKI